VQSFIILNSSSSVTFNLVNISYIGDNHGNFIKVNTGTLTLIELTLTDQTYNKPFIYVTSVDGVNITFESCTVINNKYSGDISGAFVFCSASSSVCLYIFICVCYNIFITFILFDVFAVFPNK
jgi:hypothetical protein